MKTISIAGNIGKDAVIRTTGNGDKVAGWSVAVTERSGEASRAIWFECSLWGKRGEALAQYLTKGSKVAVSGEFSIREHEGKTYLTIRVNEVTLQGGGAEKSGRDDGAPSDSGGGRGASDLDDSIPF